MNDWIEMVGGGSHRKNEWVVRTLVANGVRYHYIGRALPAPGSKSFWSTKRMCYWVHPDDVEKAKLCGLTIRRKHG